VLINLAISPPPTLRYSRQAAAITELLQPSMVASPGKTTTRIFLELTARAGQVILEAFFIQWLMKG
jgi:hypothetical protein